MIRLRRLRENEVLRNMVRETQISKSDLVYPVFIKEGTNEKNPVDSMPGIYQYTLDRFDEELERIQAAGIPAILIFGIPEHKDECGSGAYDENGITQRAVREIKKKAPDRIDYDQAAKWFDLIDSNNLSYAAWNLSNKAETSSLIDSSCTKTSSWTDEDYSETGKWLKKQMHGEN